MICTNELTYVSLRILESYLNLPYSLDQSKIIASGRIQEGEVPPQL